jgi:hypothetical protein
MQTNQLIKQAEKLYFEIKSRSAEVAEQVNSCFRQALEDMSWALNSLRKARELEEFGKRLAKDAEKTSRLLKLEEKKHV